MPQLFITIKHLKMKFSSTASRVKLSVCAAAIAVSSAVLMSSSHREAPMIADDPTADNTDVYAFRSPTNPDKVVLIANYIPFQLPDGGPNYYHFAEDVRYEIHVDNNIDTKGDDICYRFTFKRMNEDPSTFFLIRLGKENLKTTYKLERKMGNGGFQTIIANGVVPPPNVGIRSISSSPAGLKAPDYSTLMKKAIMTSSSGERVFAGQIEDPFFVDAGGIFDLGDAPRTSGNKPKDVLRCLNVHSLAIEVDIATLQKDKKPVSMAKTILDDNYVIGVWASASRQKMSVLNGDGTKSASGDWVQVSRLGMPLTNEVLIPIGMKDKWNASSPYDAAANAMFAPNFYNPELALYMDDALFGGAVPAFKPLRIQKKSLGEFGFGNTQDGLFILKNTNGVQGSALSESAFGSVLLPGPGKPRSVDIFPIFNTGVPNLPPYQLATKRGTLNPFVAGKPFVNNFLPNGGDMLRLNMAVPVTARNSTDFSSLGLVQAAALGLTDARFNTTKDLQNIPNMDGFPNGRRLEDDVTLIELQAVSGVVLAAIGFFYDDYERFVTPSPVTPQLLNVLSYRTGIDKNDNKLQTEFPFVQKPYAGNGPEFCDGCSDAGQTMSAGQKMSVGSAPMEMKDNATSLKLATPKMAMTTQNPVIANNTIRYNVATPSHVQILVHDVSGKLVKVLVNKKHQEGTYTIQWNTAGIGKGSYFITANKDGSLAKTLQVVKN